jgi:hypothetical protein
MKRLTIRDNPLCLLLKRLKSKSREIYHKEPAFSSTQLSGFGFFNVSYKGLTFLWISDLNAVLFFGKLSVKKSVSEILLFSVTLY